MSDLLKRLLSVAKDSPNVGILMSGSGTNAINILNNKNMYPTLNFKLVATENPQSNGKEIAKKYNLDYLEKDWKLKKSREDFFHELLAELKAHNINMLVYAGFMKIVPEFFAHAIPGINIHPADLTIKNTAGIPKYIGAHALQDAVMDGLDYTASTVHIVDANVDEGSIIAVSKHMYLKDVKYTTLDQLQDLSKQYCDHTIYPQVLKCLAAGDPIDMF